MTSLASEYALITGGAGFIGTNLAQRLVQEGRRVVLLDNLSRPGVEANAEWLRSLGSDKITLERDDCRNFPRVLELVRGASEVYHLAAQVAVTTSLVDPVQDFEVNAGGTLNVLEALRRAGGKKPLVFTSTNKVYGALPEVELHNTGTRYEPVNAATAESGIDERQPLDFHSPYGCSKGAADQYVLDYARSFGIPAVVFRMSCIYGPHQCGNEDQGWVAHFLKRVLADETITVFGNGLQVRDVLYVDDLVSAFLLARDNAAELRGQAFNMGGGPRNTVSLLELLEQIRTLAGREPRVRFEPSRVGDQRYYVSSFRKFRALAGWAPAVAVNDGLSKLHDWLQSASAVSRARAESDPRALPAQSSAAQAS